jgi:hypothetical protein
MQQQKNELHYSQDKYLYYLPFFIIVLGSKIGSRELLANIVQRKLIYWLNMAFMVWRTTGNSVGFQMN